MQRIGMICLLLFLSALIVVPGAMGAPQIQIPQSAIKEKLPQGKLAKVKPDLAVTALQTATQQRLDRLRYQVKIKNEGTTPYTGGAKLLPEVGYHIMSQNRDEWKVAGDGIEIPPLAPGEERNLQGEVNRPGNTISFRASVQFDGGTVASRSQPVQPLPELDVEISDVNIFSDHLLVTVRNKTDYHTAGVLALQAEGGVIQPDQSIVFSPAGGQAVELLPRGEKQAWISIYENYPVMKLKLFQAARETHLIYETQVDLAAAKLGTKNVKDLKPPTFKLK